jgi:hypothetical protein
MTLPGSLPMPGQLGSAYLELANIVAEPTRHPDVRTVEGRKGCRVAGTFGAGSDPVNLVFDGAMWVVNEASNNVIKLRASDGACVGTCTFTRRNSA